VGHGNLARRSQKGGATYVSGNGKAFPIFLMPLFVSVSIPPKEYEFALEKKHKPTEGKGPEIELYTTKQYGYGNGACYNRAFRKCIGMQQFIQRHPIISVEMHGNPSF
jgi:hypothetical protein